jgi:hypothetical protein
VLIGKAPESFLLRLWLEVREIAGAPAELRGHIEHLASGKREYVTSYRSIEEFIDDVLGGGTEDVR